MANPEHVQRLLAGVEVWNEWRRTQANVRPDLRQAELHAAKLMTADLREANLSGAKLQAANLGSADLSKANLTEADLQDAKLSQANLRDADLSHAELNDAWLNDANLVQATLFHCKLVNAKLMNAQLAGAVLIGTNLERANLTGCEVQGMFAWGLKLKEAIQRDIQVKLPVRQKITVDQLEIAQLLHLRLSSKNNLFGVETISPRLVLVLGEYRKENWSTFSTIRAQLRTHGYVPLRLEHSELGAAEIETIATLASLSRFVLFEISDIETWADRLPALLPHLTYPIIPIWQASSNAGRKQKLLKTSPNLFFRASSYSNIDELASLLAERIFPEAESLLNERSRHPEL